MHRTTFYSCRDLARDLVFPMRRILKEDCYELSLIILAVVWTAGSFIASIFFPTGNWFCRSGAVMVLLAVMVDYRIGNLQKTHISNASIIAGLGIPSSSRLPKNKQILSKGAHILAIIGTLIWGYGDLIC